MAKQLLFNEGQGVGGELALSLSTGGGTNVLTFVWTDKHFAGLAGYYPVHVPLVQGTHMTFEQGRITVNTAGEYLYVYSYPVFAEMSMITEKVYYDEGQIIDETLTANAAKTWIKL